MKHKPYQIGRDLPHYWFLHRNGTMQTHQLLGFSYIQLDQIYTIRRHSCRLICNSSKIHLGIHKSVPIEPVLYYCSLEIWLQMIPGYHIRFLQLLIHNAVYKKKSLDHNNRNNNLGSRHHPVYWMQKESNIHYSDWYRRIHQATCNNPPP